MNELTTTKRLTPEDRELTNKKAELEKREAKLAQRELDLLTFQVELREFDQLYLKTVGVFYAELDELEALFAEAKAAAFPQDETAQNEAKRARTRARESADATGAIKETPLRERFKPSDSLKKLFRELAPLLHPDLVLDEKEKAKRHELMAKANKAYEARDEDLLAQMLRERQASPDAVEGDGIGAELVRTIRRIALAEERIEQIDREFQNLKESELFELKSRVQQAKLDGRDLLQEMANQVTEKIRDARASLSALESNGE